jgi:hypothetical protein
MLTLREHLEWITKGQVDGNPLGWIVDASEHAVEALAILRSCEVEEWWDNDTAYTYANPLRLRLVPDPERGS